MGLCIAGLLGLDLFQAILSSPDSMSTVRVLEQSTWQGEVWDWTRAPLHIGLLLTGVLMGLGSSPTHEVIRVLQKYKESRQLLNIPEATKSEVPGTQTDSGTSDGKAAHRCGGACSSRCRRTRDVYSFPLSAAPGQPSTQGSMLTSGTALQCAARRRRDSRESLSILGSSWAGYSD